MASRWLAESPIPSYYRGQGHNGGGDSDSISFGNYESDSDYYYDHDSHCPPDGVGEIVDLDKLPDPDLTPEETCLPDEQLALRIALKKLSILDGFGKLDLKSLIAFVDSSDDYYNYEYGKEDEVLFQNGDSPEMFHLMWFKNSDKAYILNRWLTDRASTLDVPSSPDSISRSVVAAFFAADGFWYRAIVLEALNENRIRVIFMDYGNRDVIPLHYVRILPEGLESLPPLCFSAKLADLNPFGSLKTTLNKETKAEFISMMANQKAIKARLKEYDELGQLWVVYLWIGPEPFVEVNEKLRQKLMRKNLALENLSSDVSKADLNKMIHLTHEVNIREYREMSFKGVKNYRVTHVVNPGNFSVEVMGQDERCVPQMPWHELMQKFYNDPFKAEQYRLRTSRVFLNRCYIWRQPADGIWQRVRTIKSWVEIRRCEIYTLDVGYFTTTSFDDIYELSSQFVSQNARTCNAYLLDVAPPGGDTSWPKEAIEGFANLVRGKTFHGVAVTREAMSSDQPTSDIIRLGLILMEREKESKCTLNSQLCSLDLAEASGLGAGRRDLSIEVGDEADNFDPEHLKEYLLCAGKDPGIVIDMNPGGPDLTTSIFDGEGDKLVSWTCKTPSVYPWLRNDNVANILVEEKEHLPSMFRRKLGICNILRVVSPSCFYIQSASKTAELINMMTNIGEIVKGSEPPDPDALTEGEFLAVNLMDDKSKQTWHRAVLKQNLPKIKMVKIILVDFGAEVCCRAELVRYLPEYFHLIPAYCQRVHLSPTGLRPYGRSAWTQPAKDAFRRYLRSWEDQIPVYYAFIPKGATKIQLKEFDQEVEYDAHAEKWIPSSAMRNLPFEQHLLPMRDHPMLKNLFWTIGIDISYEIFTPQDNQYKFERIWDFLLENGFSNKTGPLELEEEDRSGLDLEDPNWENYPNV